MRAYTAGDTDVPLLEETIGGNFERVVARFPFHDALIEAAPVPGGDARRWSYTKMNDDVDRLARALIAVGVAKGDRVGIWSPNCAEWTLLQYATAKAGAILVNVNPAYRRHELQFVVKQNGMRLLVTAPSDRTSDYVGMAREALAGCPDLRGLVFLPAPAEEGFDAGVPLSDAELTYAELLRRADAVGHSSLKARMAELSPHDPINLQYTSGTTGFPKGATLTHRNILNNGFSIGELLRYTEHDRVVIPVPFYHCFGMVIGNLNALSHGAATIIPGRGFNPAAALEAVQDFGGTSLYGVPTMFIAELALPDFASYDLSTLRTGVMAGSPCPVEVMNRVISEMNMKDVAICYGMTETSPVSTMTRHGDTLRQRTETVGRAMPHLESKVVDPASGEVLERGQIGELCTRGYAVMAGYWNQPDKTIEAIDPDGWMHTGDLARMDGDGYVVIEGRIKDMVIRGGENIYPREIEEFLYTHPSVQDVQVIGVPDATYGEELMACIILKPGAEPLDQAAVAGFCRGKLAHYKIPRYVEVRDSFPMTVSGKIRKVEMREQAVARLGL
ncbi:acyl-CoA synthetase (AMP-forming)/AMP-acid ligase II [Pseudarthrobacter phenanthrenivorans Sphe3]|uniref:Acyl-CoA synthetase (AMP-forming)/AMP-acid ligase II n=1 Tax=Pseudarthrobacter phenanthrenivorans (strain DSM 18606 / JCM 16027 / LMG 23796 / Sphe3) TaxID=930171 RepID=F0MAS4_PSEPM|nr:AMP-binding protein [Pseudarthrobacter phenanthrenivorans]ADX74007.1 acyl-CoA synthetase (AMP-forming)/AMP-acid ligase II [Pseudarthrobacter phenanthrenivorans Sphe3]